jgi:hypothetical protein
MRTVTQLTEGTITARKINWRKATKMFCQDKRILFADSISE